jgi:hypothetical protein
MRVPGVLLNWSSGPDAPRVALSFSCFRRNHSSPTPPTKHISGCAAFRVLPPNNTLIAPFMVLHH